ncbi:short-chain dehydrogenase (plasmid) [Cellulomonas sp. WB94]|uniref:SDR family oxidoreductase n=1 Tax=Cellulomonas sp. WB94 TaxID=2173174 RepID=UPI000D57D946|nr:SDR family oxidoreductase [Cellulomonas sp. WB94]PVU84287.1 short-chain dehydrogenase [Cellulomonas sp. WB94]
MPTTRDLTGTVVALTGATAGIGRETARLLVAEGARVALGGRRVERLDELVAELGADNAVGVPMDVRVPADNARLVAAAIDRWGRLDSVVANAGIGMYGGILDHSDEDLATMMDTNYAGTVWTVRAALPALLTGNGGDVVIVSSVAGFRGGADEAVYAGTKHAQVGLAGALDRELREQGIRVTLICPAGTTTEFAVGAGRTEDDPRSSEWLTPQDVASAIVATLHQPRTMRTAIWTLWSMGQGS